MYNNQTGLSDVEQKVVQGAMWLKARLSNYQGSVKEWPTIKIDNGKMIGYINGETIQIPFNEPIVTEKKVLKIKTDKANDVPNEPMPQENPLAQEFPQDDMGDEMPTMGDEKNPFDTNFDAGVEANEDNDPKKYIQQLTGKLSQSLRDYNETNGEPDNDLNKYVAGMIIPQATDNLDEKGKKEIIQKINDGSKNSDDTFDDEDFENDSNNEEVPPMDGGMPMEGRKRVNYTKKQFNRIAENFGDVNGVLDKETDKDRVEKNISKSIVKNTKTKPYISPKFK